MLIAASLMRKRRCNDRTLGSVGSLCDSWRHSFTCHPTPPSAPSSLLSPVSSASHSSSVYHSLHSHLSTSLHLSFSPLHFMLLTPLLSLSLCLTLQSTKVSISYVTPRPSLHRTVYLSLPSTLRLSFCTSASVLLHLIRRPSLQLSIKPAHSQRPPNPPSLQYTHSWS